MSKVLVTGRSGTGKSTALRMLGERGHRVVDTDADEWSCWVSLPDGSAGWIWRADAIASLLATHTEGHLFVAGCKINQGKFYAQFDHIVLRSAPAEIDASAPIGQVAQQLEELALGACPPCH